MSKHLKLYSLKGKKKDIICEECRCNNATNMVEVEQDGFKEIKNLCKECIDYIEKN